MVLIIKTYLKLCGISLWSNYPDDSLWIDLNVLNVMNHSVPIIQNNINFTVNFLPFNSIFCLLMGGGQCLLILLFICKFKRNCFQQENVGVGAGLPLALSFCRIKSFCGKCWAITSQSSLSKIALYFSVLILPLTIVKVPGPFQQIHPAHNHKTHPNALWHSLLSGSPPHNYAVNFLQWSLYIHQKVL